MTLSVELVERIRPKFSEVEILLINEDGETRRSILIKFFTTKGVKKNPNRVILRAHRYSSMLCATLDIPEYKVNVIRR